MCSSDARTPRVAFSGVAAVKTRSGTMSVFKGFKNFLMQGDLVVIAVGLVIALAFSTLIKAFTDNIITPLVNAAGGGGSSGLGFRVNGSSSISVRSFPP
jgi:hypothetical protein